MSICRRRLMTMAGAAALSAPCVRTEETKVKLIVGTQDIALQETVNRLRKFAQK